VKILLKNVNVDAENNQDSNSAKAELKLARVAYGVATVFTYFSLGLSPAYLASRIPRF